MSPTQSMLFSLVIILMEVLLLGLTVSFYRTSQYLKSAWLITIIFEVVLISMMTYMHIRSFT